MKGFATALTDGFKHIMDISDPELLSAMREDGILVDSEGYWVFSFGEHKEYEWRILPFGDEDRYLIGIYKNGVLLNERLPIWGKNE